MEEGVFYELQPPSKIQGKLFDRVKCECEVPSHPGEFIVTGIPRGETKPESFLLRFSKERGVNVSRSENQSELRLAD
jgi:hypothetical protein